MGGGGPLASFKLNFNFPRRFQGGPLSNICIPGGGSNFFPRGVEWNCFIERTCVICIVPLWALSPVGLGGVFISCVLA